MSMQLQACLLAASGGAVALVGGMVVGVQRNCAGPLQRPGNGRVMPSAVRQMYPAAAGARKPISIGARAFGPAK